MKREFVVVGGRYKTAQYKVCTWGFTYQNLLLIIPPFTIQTTIASSSSGNQNLNSSETPIKSSNYQLSNAP